MILNEFLKAENLIATSSFFVALASLIISLVIYRQDQGRLDFYVGLGEIWGGTPFRMLQNVLQFRIVNSGRRAVILNAIGGDKNGEFVVSVLSKFNAKKFRTTSFLLHSPAVTEVITSNGQPKTLTEGMSVSFHLPLPEAEETFELIALNCRSVYVIDTVGKKHFVSKGVFRALRNSYQRRSFQQGPVPLAMK